MTTPTSAQALEAASANGVEAGADTMAARLIGTPARRPGGTPAELPAPAPSANSRVATTSPSLSLHIDRLVVDGVALNAHDQARLMAALQSELSVLFAERGPGAAIGAAIGAAFGANLALARLPVGALTLPHAADAQQLGRAIAQALHRGLAA